MRILAIASLATALAPALASAHPVHGSPPGNPFRIIDRPDPHDAVGVDLAIGGLVGDDDPDELLSFRFELYGRAALTPSFGITAALPIAGLTITGDNGDDELAIDAFDLGGYFFTALTPDSRTTLVVRGSFTTPTASDDAPGVLTNLIASEIGRLDDVVLAFPDLVALRTAVSIIHDAEGVIFRVDGALDTPLLSTDDAVDLEHDPIIRLNAGLALGSGTSRLVLEVANLANSDNLDEAGDFVHQAAVGATVNSGKLLYGFSASVLLDSLFDDNIDGAVVGVIGSISSGF